MRSLGENETYCHSSYKVNQHMSWKLSVVLTHPLSYTFAFQQHCKEKMKVAEYTTSINKYSLILRLRSPILDDGVVYPVLVGTDSGVDSWYIRPAAAYAETDDAYLEPAAPVLADQRTPSVPLQVHHEITTSSQH